MHLLLIEDDPGYARFVRRLLSSEPVAPRPRVVLSHAESLRDSLAQVAQKAFGALLLDLGLPDSYGLETLVEVRERAPGIPVVVLTAAADDKDRPSVLIVVGTPGEAEYESEFRRWANLWEQAAGHGGAEVVRIGDSSAGDGTVETEVTDRDRLRSALDGLPSYRPGRSSAGAESGPVPAVSGQVHGRLLLSPGRAW